MDNKVSKKKLFIKNTKLAADFYISIFAIVLAIVFIMEARSLPTKVQGIGAGDYPRVICAILIFLGVLQFIKCLIMAKGLPVPDAKTIDGRGLLRVSVMVVVTYIFYRLLKLVGFPILAPIYLFFTICFFGYKKRVRAAIISIAFSTIVYILFTKVFLVILPSGILG